MAAALGPYLPWIAWTFVPSLATNIALKLLYTSSLLSRPQTPSLAHKQSSTTRALLVAAYLAYSFYASLSAPQPSAYKLLGLDLDASVEQIKKAFRKSALIYHPDKVGAQGESFFIALRRSHDVLSDPVKRFAYDRFGIDVLDWKDAISYREHMAAGLRKTLIFWITNPLIYAIISWLSSDKSAFSYWHLTFLFALIIIEVNMVITPRRPAVLQWLTPNTTVHEVTMVVHQIYTSFIMAARQLLPFLSFPKEEMLQGPKTLKEAQAFLDALATEMGKLKEMANAFEATSQELFEADIQSLCHDAQQQQVSGGQLSVKVAPSDAAGNMFSPAKLQERYAHLASNRLLLQSIEGVSPEFRAQTLLSKAKETSPQTIGIPVRRGIPAAGEGTGEDEGGTISSESIAASSGIDRPGGPWHVL